MFFIIQENMKLNSNLMLEFNFYKFRYYYRYSQIKSIKLENVLYCMCILNTQFISYKYSSN